MPEVYENKLFNHTLAKLNNGYYEVRKTTHFNRTFVGLIPIYYKYDATNSFLKEGFNKNLSLLYQSKISFNSQEGEFICSKDGKFLFSLQQSPLTDSRFAILYSNFTTFHYWIFYYKNLFIILFTTPTNT